MGWRWDNFKTAFKKAFDEAGAGLQWASPRPELDDEMIKAMTRSIQDSREHLEEIRQKLPKVTVNVETTPVHPVGFTADDQRPVAAVYKRFTILTHEGWELDCELPDTIQLPNTLPVFENMTFVLNVPLVVKYPPKKESS